MRLIDKEIPPPTNKHIFSNKKIKILVHHKRKVMVMDKDNFNTNNSLFAVLANRKFKMSKIVLI